MNPFGILYNPLSIEGAIRQLLSGKTYQESDLFFASGQWHSWMHHSHFSAETVSDCLANINGRLEQAKTHLKASDWMIFTWGTAFVYQHKALKQVVGNCHKQSDKLFERRKLSVQEIVEVWQALLADLKRVNPKLKVLFTVSPIRHTKDGMHENQLSKATLLLAIDELCRCCPDCFYFPSYEIVMDELRDYRFYADDMIHPSGKAIAYIWECFADCYFSKETQTILREWEEIKRGLDHKPFRPDSEAYRQFLSQIVLKIHRIKEKLPYFDGQKEIEACETRLKI